MFLSSISCIYIVGCLGLTVGTWRFFAAMARHPAIITWKKHSCQQKVAAQLLVTARATNHVARCESVDLSLLLFQNVLASCRKWLNLLKSVHFHKKRGPTLNIISLHTCYTSLGGSIGSLQYRVHHRFTINTCGIYQAIL